MVTIFSLNPCPLYDALTFFPQLHFQWLKHTEYLQFSLFRSMIHGVLRSMSTLVDFVVLKCYINKVELDWSGWDEPSLSRLIKTEARTQWSSLHLETESNTTWPRNEVTKKSTCFTSILLFIAQHKTILWVGFLFFFSFLTTYTMYSHNTPYSYKERERLNKNTFFSFFFFFTYCILDMKNKEPRTILKLNGM